MRHARSLDFDGLEARQLLARAHPAAVHRAPPPPVTPIVIDGTINVDNKAASVSQDDSGDTTTSTPVAGTLGAIGPVRGIWDTTVDAYGDYLGPDSLELKGAKGVLVIAFNTSNPGKVTRTSQGVLSYTITQRLHNGTGAYARTSENGTIQLFTNTGQTMVEKMTLETPA